MKINIINEKYKIKLINQIRIRKITMKTIAVIKKSVYQITNVGKIVNAVLKTAVNEIAIKMENWAV